MNPSPSVSRNQPGWFAIRHSDGWFVGDSAGVLCYEDHDFARAALTICWQRDGGGPLRYRIVQLTGADFHEVGEHTPSKSAEQALKDYENPRRKKA